MATAQAQLDGFIEKYSPAVAKLGRAAIARMRKLLPAAQVLVYDNYNAQQALAGSGASLQTGKRGPVVIKSISTGQRPRRSATSAKTRARS